MDELEKKAIQELKKVEPIVEQAIVQAVDGRTFGCWGWSVRIYRNPTPPTPPKSAEGLTPDSTSASRDVPVSV